METVLFEVEEETEVLSRPLEDRYHRFIIQLSKNLEEENVKFTFN